MSIVTEINKHIAEGYNMGQIALAYYKKVRPEKNYDVKGARNMFVRDSSIDFKVLRQVATDIYYDQLGLLNMYEAKINNK